MRGRHTSGVAQVQIRLCLVEESFKPENKPELAYKNSYHEICSNESKKRQSGYRRGRSDQQHTSSYVHIMLIRKRAMK